MSFVHEDPEFGQLVQIVARETGIAAALIEKDYWVTHTLWALHQTGLDIWFKGGTSLSKGFGLIKRFSEDLDLVIEQGKVKCLPDVTSWTSTNKGLVGGEANRPSTRRSPRHWLCLASG
jgi:predicted nucleotidyltransferase component of viral defense system